MFMQNVTKLRAFMSYRVNREKT